jgi:dihydrofolate reductase
MEWMSLDGVIQAPSFPDEDTTDGFVGGWHTPYLDDVAGAWVVDTLQQAGGFLFGRRTYETFAQHWPHASAEEAPLAEPLNTKPKLVASRQAGVELAWQPATAAARPLEQAREFAATLDGPLVVIGSGDLVSQLISAGELDELHVMIDPLVIGRGKRLFASTARESRHFDLGSSTPTATGAILASYVRHPEDEAG